MQHPEVAELWKRANELVAELETWIASHDGRSLRLSVSEDDQVRLLKLRTWMFRYHLPVNEILDILIPLLRDRVKRKKISHRLGVAIRTLTGHGAEEMLVVELNRKYPGGEHVHAWKEAERERQLEVEQLEMSDGMPEKQMKLFNILDYPSTNAYLDDYRARIEAKRKLVSSESVPVWRKRKNYRGNPWK